MALSPLTQSSTLTTQRYPSVVTGDSAGYRRTTGAMNEITNLSQARLDTPIGRLVLFGTVRGLLRIVLPNESDQHADTRIRRLGAEVLDDDGNLAAAKRQLEEYFSGRRQAFDLPLDMRGTSFQIAVWRAVAEVPFGETRSYGWIARQIGRPTATRAVGAANGVNPLPIVVPCHRVVGSDGSLTGYGGGLSAKAWLLALERPRQFELSD